MSSENSRNEPSQPKDIESSRIRTQSECSNISDDGASSSTGKRQRTISQTFMVASGLTSASPPKFVSLEEIMQAANGLQDMALVHQIVIDKDFRLEPFVPEENSLVKVVKDNLHKAFWNIFKDQLAEDPPNYSQVIDLLTNVKSRLFSLLLPQHTKIKQQISDVLDTALIKQQVEQGTLDFNHYSRYVIGLMGKFCAPVRDERIRELETRTDVVETFRGILETLDLMVLDIANFTLEMSKSDIIANSVEYERRKFDDLLKIQPDGLEITRKWVVKHLNDSFVAPAGDEYISFVRATTRKIVRDAYIDLLEWPKNEPYPETFLLDEARLLDLQIRTNRLINMATILLITVSNVGSDLQSISTFKEKLKDHCAIIFQSYKTDNDLEELIPNIIAQVMKDVKEAQETYNLQKISEDGVINLSEQLKGVAKADNRIKQLVRLRVKQFYLHIIQSQTADPEKVPGGLTTLQHELLAIAGQFLRLVSLNMTVFCIYYYDIVSAALPKPTTTTTEPSTTS